MMRVYGLDIRGEAAKGRRQHTHVMYGTGVQCAAEPETKIRPTLVSGGSEQTAVACLTSAQHTPMTYATYVPLYQTTCKEEIDTQDVCRTYSIHLLETVQSIPRCMNRSASARGIPLLRL